MQELAKRTLTKLAETAASTEPVWQPFPGPQTRAYSHEADITGYGGAAGGGKSDLMIGLALSQHRRSVIFRREATQARDLFERARVVAPLSESNKTYLEVRVPGRVLEFAGVKDADDVQKWRGRPHDLIGFDEATEFQEQQIRFLMGWLRTTEPGQRTRVVLTFNPPGNSDGRWIIEFFAPWLKRGHPNPALPGELRWYAMVGGKEIECPNGDPVRDAAGELVLDAVGNPIRPRSRTFIPARLTDNPALMATDYGANLAAMPEPYRSQLLYGDFDAGVKDDDWQVIPTAWIDAAFDRWEKRERPAVPLTSVGIDVARGGDDQTIFAPSYQNWFAPLLVFPGSATPDGFAIAREVAALDLHGHRIAAKTTLQIDIVGVGSSPADILAGNGYNVVALNGGAGSEATDNTGHLGFVNKRSEWYWKFREALDPDKGSDLAICPDDELRADLTAPRWEARSGKIKVESKPDIKKRIGRSPDKADAIVYAHATSWVDGWGAAQFYARQTEQS